MKEKTKKKYSTKIQEIPNREQKYQEYLDWLPDDKDKAWTDWHTDAIYISTPMKLVEHAFQTFGFTIKDGHAAPEIYTWLESVDWLTLSDWNKARSRESNHLKPASRNSKSLAIEDCVADFYTNCAEDKNCWRMFMIHPLDLAKFAGLSAKHMKMTQFELGYEMANITPKSTATTATKTAQKPKVKHTTKTPQQTYASTIKKSIDKKSTTVVGKGAVKIGIQPQKLALHLRIQKGGDISKIAARLRQSKLSKATEVNTIHTSSTKNYDCYQLKCLVDYSKLSFWLEEGFWPVGVTAKRWFGKEAVPFDQKKLTKKIFMSNIGDVTAATVISHIKSVAYPNVEFKNIHFDKLDGGNGAATMEIDKPGEIAKFRKEGLVAERFPVRVKWFKQRKTKTTAWFTA